MPHDACQLFECPLAHISTESMTSGSLQPLRESHLAWLVSTGTFASMLRILLCACIELLALLQVLRHQPKRFRTEVLCKLTARSASIVNGLKYALQLSQELLPCWLASTPAALDLRDAELTAVQWSRLFSALSQEGTHLTTIHIRMIDIPVGDSALFQVECSAIDQLVRSGRSIAECIKSTTSSMVHVLPDCARNLTDTLNRLQSLRADGVVNHKLAKQSECAQALNTLAGVLPQLTSLTHLGMHHLQLHAQLMPSLGQVLMNLPPSVTALTLTTAASAKQPEVGRLQRSMLFNAIALVKSLRELHMPNWEDTVGDDGACFEPLSQVPHLQAVYVEKIGQSSAFPEWLGFKEMPNA
jgi:hypothetical protein